MSEQFIRFRSVLPVKGQGPRIRGSKSSDVLRPNQGYREQGEQEITVDKMLILHINCPTLEIVCSIIIALTVVKNISSKKKNPEL